MAATPDAAEIFDKSLALFRASLNEQQRRAFRAHANVEIMFDELERTCSGRRNGSKLLECCQRLRSFSTAFAPYFDIIAILVQIKPEWLGIFWGSVRLIFQLGTNFVILLDKVSDMLESLSWSLPQFQTYFDILRQRPSNQQMPRAVTLLAYLYADVLQLVQEIVEMLSRTGSAPGAMSRLTMIVKRVWKPMTTRFREAEIRMTRHESLLEREFRVITERNATEHIADFQAFVRSFQEGEEADEPAMKKEQQQEESRIAFQLKRIRNWIGPVDYTHIPEKARRARQDGTGHWFLEREDYIQFRDAEFQGVPVKDLSLKAPGKMSWLNRVMILQAKPGFGKTVLSTTIIDDIERILTGLSSPHSVCFYHFSSVDEFTRSHSAAFKALILQLLQNHRREPATIDALTIFHEEQAKSHVQASYADMEEVLRLLLSQYPTFIVIDGIEEARESGELMERLFLTLNDTDTKMILLARPTISIPEAYTKISESMSCVINLNAEDSQVDFHVYFKHVLSKMVSAGLFGRQHNVVQKAADLARRANGMFLWADLMTRYLRSDGLTPQRRLYAMENANLLEGLNGIYTGILSLLCEGYSHDQTMASSIFRWVACSIYPLASETLKIALSINPGQQTDESQYLCDWPACLHRITGALVETYAGRAVFLHASFLEFLSSDNSLRFPTFSLANKAPAHAYLATQCFSYLAHDVSKKPLKTQKLDAPAGQSHIGWTQADENSHPHRGHSRAADYHALLDEVNTSSQYQIRNDSLLSTTSPQIPEASVDQMDLTDLVAHFEDLLETGRYTKASVHRCLECGSRNLQSDKAQCEYCRRTRRGSTELLHEMEYEPKHLTLPDHRRLPPETFSGTPPEPVQGSTPPSSFMNDTGHPRTPARQAGHYKSNLQGQQANDSPEDIRNALEKLPFLSYAALTCFVHLRKSFEEQIKADARVGMSYALEPEKPRSRGIRAMRTRKNDTWLPVLSQFLVQRSARTCWAEACFHFKLIPDLKPLLPTLDLLQEHADIGGGAEDRELWWVCHGVRQLDQALQQLRETYKDTLMGYPAVIWSRGITSATDHEYWAIWNSQTQRSAYSEGKQSHDTREPFEGDRSPECPARLNAGASGGRDAGVVRSEPVY